MPQKMGTLQRRVTRGKEVLSFEYEKEWLKRGDSRLLDPQLQLVSEWLHLLLAPGTSLGGARPKATVMDPAGEFWVAKFPSRSDEFDVGAWESLVYGLAQQAGIQTVQARAEQFSKQGTAFLIKRFDRAGENRIHFASAMTLLGYHGGDNA